MSLNDISGRKYKLKSVDLKWILVLYFKNIQFSVLVPTSLDVLKKKNYIFVERVGIM